MKHEKLTEKVAFDLIRYANCWEDADVLLRGLNPDPGSKILSIGSAGDNSFSLLTTQPELVVAVDVNPIQLYLIELKRAAIQVLSYEEVLQFLGFRASEERLRFFDQIKRTLSVDCLTYWEKHRDQLNAGIITQGKFEGYFQLFVRKILPWIHTQKRVEALLAPKSASEQEAYYEKRWNTWRWRFLFKLFFSKTIMGRYGRDPEFLKEVEVSVGKTIYNKAGNHLRNPLAQRNFMLRYTLTASFGELLPHYLQLQHFPAVKANLDKLQLVQGYAEDAIRLHGTFRYMNLSNIFEYMNPELFHQTAKQLVESTEKGGRLAYWNLLVPRHIASEFPSEINGLTALSAELTANDNGFFYNQFLVDERL
jgi:S-adenosylmethionine-diacylglycerol 3-amino-3-carboxypropyl transferase